VLRAAQRGAGRTTTVVLQAHDLDLGPPPPREAPVPASADAEDGGSRGSLAERVDAFRKREIQAAVRRHSGNWAAAARELGLHRSNLHHLAQRLGLR
jgi:anaerobic nitric oxide reductase transcription regulator